MAHEANGSLVALRASSRTRRPECPGGWSLIEEKEIRLLHQHVAEKEPASLTAAQHRDELLHLVIAEEEGSEKAPDLPVWHAAGDRSDGFDHRLLRVEKLELLLGEVGDPDARARDALTRFGRERSGHELEERCLPAPLGPRKATRSSRWMERSRSRYTGSHRSSC